MQFFAFGDFGGGAGRDEKRYVNVRSELAAENLCACTLTLGASRARSASVFQKMVSDGMAYAADTFGTPRFVLALGDCIYPAGIQDGNDLSRFQGTFEDVYKLQAADAAVPFYATGGNHDHYGNISAQIEYTKLSPSARWRYPALWYSLVESQSVVRIDPATGTHLARNVTTQIVVLDSVVLAGDEAWCLCQHSDMGCDRSHPHGAGCTHPMQRRQAGCFMNPLLAASAVSPPPLLISSCHTVLL